MFCFKFHKAYILFQLQVEPLSRNSNNSKYKSIHQSIHLIYKEEGFKALWKGLLPGQFLSTTYGLTQVINSFPFKVQLFIYLFFLYQVCFFIILFLFTIYIYILCRINEFSSFYLPNNLTIELNTTYFNYLHKLFNFILKYLTKLISFHNQVLFACLVVILWMIRLDIVIMNEYLTY